MFILTTIKKFMRSWDVFLIEFIFYIVKLILFLYVFNIFSLSTLSIMQSFCITFSASPKTFNISSTSSSADGEGTSSRTSSISLTSSCSHFSKTALPDFVAQVVFALLFFTENNMEVVEIMVEQKE